MNCELRQRIALQAPMPSRTPNQLPSELPPTVTEVLRKRFSGRELQAVSTFFALRTAARQVDNIVTEWLSGSAGSPARFQILSLLWASEGAGVPHKKIVAALGVTRATVSGLMAALERDGLVKSMAGPVTTKLCEMAIWRLSSAVVPPSTPATAK